MSEPNVTTTKIRLTHLPMALILDSGVRMPGDQVLDSMGNNATELACAIKSCLVRNRHLDEIS